MKQQKYQIIYADPPWTISQMANIPSGRPSARPYKSMRQEEHSKKPNEVREKIIALCGDLPRLELFARQKTNGWDVWGDEIKNDIDMNIK